MNRQSFWYQRLQELLQTTDCHTTPSLGSGNNFMKPPVFKHLSVRAEQTHRDLVGWFKNPVIHEIKKIMADYFTYFSVILPLSPEQQKYALQVAHQAQENRLQDKPWPPEFPEELKAQVEGWCFETESTQDGLWLHSIEGGQDSACAFIQHLLQKFEFVPAVAFEWSYDCSKPRPDAYGGGAAFVTVAEIKTFTTSEWLQKMTCPPTPTKTN